MVWSCSFEFALFCFPHDEDEDDTVMMVPCFYSRVHIENQGFLWLWLNLVFKYCSRNHLSSCVYAHRSPSVCPKSPQLLRPQKTAFTWSVVTQAGPQQATDSILTWVMFQLLRPQVEWYPGYFPIKPDGRTLDQTSERSSRPKDIIYHPLPTSNQSVPAPSNQGVWWFCLIEWEPTHMGHRRVWVFELCFPFSWIALFRVK